MPVRVVVMDLMCAAAGACLSGQKEAPPLIGEVLLLVSYAFCLALNMMISATTDATMGDRTNPIAAGQMLPEGP